MSYNSYKARVERRRAALQAKLTQGNDLRRASHLPLWDIEAELARQCPWISEDAWTVHQQERRAFAHFRRVGLAGKVMPTLPAGADWQQVRALGLRRAYLEHQIEQAWFLRAKAETISADPPHPGE